MSLLSPEVESTYEILQQIGEGGMGATFKARHRLFNEVCVIKVMKAEHLDKPNLRERFQQEALKGKEIDHPHIARVLNFFIGGNGNPHLVMEFIDGIDVRKFLERRGGVLDPATTVKIALQVLSGLACLHERGLVHRDISPDNIMLVQDRTGAMHVKLIDLGIVKSLDSDATATRVGYFVGKPHYAAPEQFGGQVDARSDLYAFGIVLYELLTGRLPIDAANFNALAAAQYNEPPIPFSQSDREGRIPDELRRVVLKALEKQPGRRFQSAAEFSAALGGSEIPVPKPAPAPPAPAPPAPAPSPTPAPQPVVVPKRSRKWVYITALAAVLIVAKVIMGFVGTTLTDRQKTDLGNLIRTAVDEGREPSMKEPSIAAFLQKEAIDADDAEKFAVEFSVKVRDSMKHIDRGKAAIERGDIREAYDAFNAAKITDPESSYAWSNFGAAAMLLDRQAEATEAYQKALQIDPTNWIAHYNVACQYARAGRFSDAIDKVAVAVDEMRRKSTADVVKANLGKIRQDKALEDLRDDPRFQKIVAAR